MAGPAVITAVAPIDNHDVQGLVRHGYGHLRSAAYLLLHIDQRAAARAWLGELIYRITDAASGHADTLINIAFTFVGLRALGLDEEALTGFSPEFEEGLAGNPHRSRQLGDVGDSAPAQWRWGGDRAAIHAVLTVYAANDDALKAELCTTAAPPPGVRLLDTLRCSELPAKDPHPGLREHFGFRDGLSQPDVAGWHDDGPPRNRVATGEFLLGYPNAYGQLNESPRVPDGRRALPDGDFGRNGTYLVLRELEQDVAGFWSCLLTAAAGNVDEAIRLAAKMVGRWPSGMPLVLAPSADPGAPPDHNDFGYAADDIDGTHCPLGAHIRRSNPRDAMFRTRAEDPEDDPAGRVALSVEVSNRHRIIRRGRPYGPPLAASLQPQDLIQAAVAAAKEKVPAQNPAPAGPPRGLFFVCLNANLSRQFELVQHTWLNNTEFVTGCPEQDPLLGDGLNARPSFTMQGRPLGTVTSGLTRFVHVRGGAYFFVPSLAALRYLVG
ncbi:MAG: Dyp-type peroxidase [Candidatus Binatia bacterium]